MRRGILLVIGLVAAAGCLAWWGIANRARAMTTLTSETRELNIPTVAVTKPKPGAPEEEIVLPGNLQAFADAPIYARTNGYLRRRLVDMGTRVKAGQLLAEIDAPELEQQLQQARADLATADANLRLAQLTADRYRDLVKTESVTQQDADNAAGALEVRKSSVESARHNVQRLEQLQVFTRIYAPIDGVITSRNTDVGALIDPGASGGAARELFHIASTGRLRVFVNVPQTFSRVTRQGLSADLTLAEFPGRRFTGVLVRRSEAIDAASRTLLAEFEVNNATGELLPGAFAQVHLQLPKAASTCVLPVNTLIFRGEGVRVAAVRSDSTVAMTPVTLGRDFGTEVEILDGIGQDTVVVVSPPDSLVDKQLVRVFQDKAGTPKGLVR
ncbi:MAG TPA: efflux RND transporter periplasmic adaptor subunit [Vicinamibacterales bacterium]